MATEDPASSPRQRDVRAFILRLWWEAGDGAAPGRAWRLSLEDSRTRARRGFGSLDEFFGYLAALCDDTGRQDEGQ